MLYAIYAYEDTYGGLYGMCNHAVINCKNDVDDNYVGFGMSLEVIDSYP